MIFLSFALCLIILCSCSHTDPVPFDDPTAGITVTAAADQLELNTSLTKMADISEYRSGNFVVSPNVYMGEKHIYVAHRYPEELLEGLSEITDEIAAQFFTEEVIVYDYALNEVNRIPLDWKDTPRVNVGGLCVDEESGEIHLYSSAGGLYRYIFDSAGHLTKTQKLPDSIIWNNMTYTLTPQYIYYRERDPIYTDWFVSPCQDIYRYDLQTGETELLLEDVSDFTFYGDKLLYLKCDGREDGQDGISMSEHEKYKDRMYELLKRNLYIFDPETKTHTLFAPFNTGETARFIRLSKDGRYLYFGTMEDVYCYNPETQETLHLIESSTGFEVQAMRENLLLLEMGASQVSLYHVPEEPTGLVHSSASVLSFTQYIYGSTPHEDIFKLLSRNGYSAAGELGYSSADLAEYTNTMAKKLMAGDTDFDIFYVSTEMAGLFDAAYYEDLSRYSLLNGYYDRMQPGAKGICSIDGTPCLVPVDIYTFMNRADTSYLTDEHDLPQTLEEFVQFKDQITLQNGSYLFSGNRAFVVFQPLFEQFAANFMNRTVSDREAKQDLTLLYKTVYDLMQDDTVYLGDGGTRKNHVFDFVQNRGDFNLKDEQRVIPVLKVSENYGETWHGGFYAVNPNSENKTLAVIFLACMIEDELANDRELSQLYQGEREDGGEVYDLYLSQLASGVRGYQIPDFKSYLRDQFEELESGAITPEEAADVLWRYLKMVRDE